MRVGPGTVEAFISPAAWKRLALLVTSYYYGPVQRSTSRALREVELGYATSGTPQGILCLLFIIVLPYDYHLEGFPVRLFAGRTEQATTYTGRVGLLRTAYSVLLDY